MAEEAIGTEPQGGPASGDPAGTNPGNPTPAEPKAAAASPGNPNPANKSGDDDARIKGFIADLQKERRARQTLETQIATHKAELDAERRRVQALAGVTPPDASDTERKEIKARFAELFPHLADLSEDDVKDLRQEREERKLRPWRDYGNYVVSQVQSEISKELGGDLTPRQIRTLRAFMSEELQEDAGMLERYERGDKALIADLAKTWMEDWYNPARRKLSAAEAARSRNVPRGRDRTIGTVTGEKALDVNDPKAVEDLLVKGFRERGGQFARD